MRKVKLLALRLGGRLLNSRASHQLFATHYFSAPNVAGDDQGLSCCHHNHQMIHTIPNPVKLFLKKFSRTLLHDNRRARVSVATTWNTDSVLWEIT